MKTKKKLFIAMQIVTILTISYTLLIDNGFIYRANLPTIFLFALAFFYLGTFSSLYISVSMKEFTDEKYELLFNFFMLVYFCFLALCLFNNCVIKTDELIINFILGVFMTFYVILFSGYTYKSFNAYKSSQINKS